MDIDISHFSRKAQKRLKMEILSGYPLLIGLVTFLLLSVIVQAPLVYVTAQHIRLNELSLPAVLLGFSIVLMLWWPILRWAYNKGQDLFKKKKLINGYFPKCYECNVPGNAEHVCPECGESLKVKYVDVPSLTLGVFTRQSIAYTFMTMLIIIPLAICSQNFMKIWKYRNSPLSMITSSSGSLIKLNTAFFLGQKVKYQDSIGKIVAVGIDNRCSIIYTLDVGGKKVLDVPEFSIKKIDTP